MKNFPCVFVLFCMVSVVLGKSNLIPNQFIVLIKEKQKHFDFVNSMVFNQQLSTSQAEFQVNIHKKKGNGIHSHFQVHDDLFGYVGTFSDDQVDLIKSHPSVEHV